MDKKGEYQHLKRTFGPIYDKNSEILILGSFPSVKSREANFFYGHPQNRFWKVISAVYNAPSLNTIEDKTNFLIKNKIALWDTIDSCDMVLSAANIKGIFCNGATSHKLYMKYCYPNTKVEAVKLPSTSPANAAFSLEKLISIWSDEIKKIYN